MDIPLHVVDKLRNAKVVKVKVRKLARAQLTAIRCHSIIAMGRNEKAELRTNTQILGWSIVTVMSRAQSIILLAL
jgi:hypothetical protein